MFLLSFDIVRESDFARNLQIECFVLHLRNLLDFFSYGQKTRPRVVEDRRAMRNSKWVRLLGYVSGSVNQELLLQNEYLAAESDLEIETTQPGPAYEPRTDYAGRDREASRT